MLVTVYKKNICLRCIKEKSLLVFRTENMFDRRRLVYVYLPILRTTEKTKQNKTCSLDVFEFLRFYCIHRVELFPCFGVVAAGNLKQKSDCRKLAKIMIADRESAPPNEGISSSLFVKHLY